VKSKYLKKKRDRVSTVGPNPSNLASSTGSSLTVVTFHSDNVSLLDIVRQIIILHFSCSTLIRLAAQFLSVGLIPLTTSTIYIELESANLGPHKVIVSTISRFYSPKIIVSMLSISCFVEACITSNSIERISYLYESFL